MLFVKKLIHTFFIKPNIKYDSLSQKDKIKQNKKQFFTVCGVLIILTILSMFFIDYLWIPFNSEMFYSTFNVIAIFSSIFLSLLAVTTAFYTLMLGFSNHFQEKAKFSLDSFEEFQEIVGHKDSTNILYITHYINVQNLEKSLDIIVEFADYSNMEKKPNSLKSYFRKKEYMSDIILMWLKNKTKFDILNEINYKVKCGKVGLDDEIIQMNYEMAMLFSNHVDHLAEIQDTIFNVNTTYQKLKAQNNVKELIDIYKKL